MALRSSKTARYASVVASTAVALAAGTNYAYSAWAPSFSTRVRLNTTEINVIGLCGNMGMYAMGIPAGLLIDKGSPRLGVFVGSICLAVGYALLRKGYTDGWDHMNVATLSLWSFLTGLGSCTAFSAAIKTSTYNWPDHRGTATAFPLSGFGLSAFFFTTIANLAFGDDTAKFLLLFAVGTTVLNLLSLPFMALITTSQSYSSIPSNDDNRPSRRESNRMHRTNSIKSAAIGSTAQQVADDPQSPTPDEASPLVSSSSSTPDSHDDQHHMPVQSDSHQTEITGLALLPQSEFWQLFIMLGLLAGVGLMTINNIGNDTRALWRYWDPKKDKAFLTGQEHTHVSLLSLCSFAGRLLSGIGSDYLIKRLHASRLWCLATSAIIFAIAQLFAIFLTNPNLLYIVSSLTGLAYGALFGVFPALTADAFGVQGLSLNWGFMILAPVVSGNIFNIVYGRIYDYHSNTLNDGSHGCQDGIDCYRPAYMITLASSVVGVFMVLGCIRHQHTKTRREGYKIAEREA